jgi:hypothetical protein
MNRYFKYGPFVTIVLIVAAAFVSLGAESTSGLSLTASDSPIETPVTPVFTPTPPLPEETQGVHCTPVSVRCLTFGAQGKSYRQTERK